jgi:putative tryptophan/tyrosine transport system substrate-binding protein
MRRRQFIAGLGTVAAWPVVARAQQPTVPVIGYLSGANESSQAKVTAAFRRGLGEQGFAEGRNVEILYRFADFQYHRLPEMIAELRHRRVAVLFTSGGPAAHVAAKSATATIPIVFATGSDPVQLGLVASLNRPGGNVTGVTFLSVALFAKRLEMLREIVPSITSVGHLLNSASPTAEADLRAAENAAVALGLHLVTATAESPGEIDAAFETLVTQHVGAFLESADPLFSQASVQLAALALRHGLPAVFHRREFVEAGGLMSYGASFSDAWRLAGIYAGRVLKGEAPAELPVQQSTRLETVLNLKTAKTLGIDVPTATLLRADEVIE